MQEYPEIPDVADAPADLLDGHLWLQEWVDGGHLRFGMDESGLLRFGDRTGTFDAGDPPLAYRDAVRHVREVFDRDVLRSVADDPAAMTFHGVATFRRDAEYDWARTPPFLGVDVYSGEREAFLPPDVVERALDGLGLQPVHAIGKEVRAADFQPERYEFPESVYCDGPVAGVVVRDKTGGRAKLANPAVAGGEPDAERGDADALAEECVTGERVARVADEMSDGGSDAVTERVLEAVAREQAHRLRDGRVDADALREAVGARVRALLD